MLVYCPVVFLVSFTVGFYFAHSPVLLGIIHLLFLLFSMLGVWCEVGSIGVSALLVMMPDIDVRLGGMGVVWPLNIFAGGL